MGIDCVVVDAGARYGLHPTWADLRNLVTFHLFEPDPKEADRLRQKYKNDSRITIYPLALYKEDARLSLVISEHKALNSIFSADEEVLRRNDYMRSAFTSVDAQQSDARSIDSIFEDRPVHFLKLDVEGAEHDVLSGALTMLRTSALGVRAEVLFSPLFQKAPLFGDVHELMLSQGFELLNLDYTGAGNKAGRFTLPNRYGKLISTDAVWILNNDRLFCGEYHLLRDNVIRMATFLMNNGATDLAVDILHRAVTGNKISFRDVNDDPLFSYLHKKVMLLFKSLLERPMWSEKDITTVYREIFEREFPLLNRFYESEIFS